MNDKLLNQEYWVNRYNNMSGEKVVGHKNWSVEQYIQTIKLWTGYYQPILKDITNDLSKVLDFGCGVGRWIPLLAEYFKEYYGVDIVITAIDNAKHQVPSTIKSNFDLIKDDIIPFGNTTFDMIWTCVALQHITDDLLFEYISQFRQRMNPGGYLLCTENIAERENAEYIFFRGSDFYINLFEKQLFTLKSKKII